MTNVIKHHTGPYSQSYDFSSSYIWMWQLDHKDCWAMKNWCFQIVVLEKTLRVPWTARKSNQSILKEISPKYSLEGLMLKLQYFGHLLKRANLLEKTLMLGKIEGKRRRGRQRMRRLDSVTESMDINLSKLLGIVEDRRGCRNGVLQSMGSQSRTRLSNWATCAYLPYL